MNTSAERLREKIQLALRASRQRPGPQSTWAFAAFVAPHPAGKRHGAVWWIQTVGGERMPMTTILLADLNAGDSSCWIWGQQVVTLDVGPLQADDPVVTDLIVHTLVLPSGVSVTPDDHVEIRARLSAHDAQWTSPIICTLRGPRPTSWPL